MRVKIFNCDLEFCRPEIERTLRVTPLWPHPRTGIVAEREVACPRSQAGDTGGRRPSVHHRLGELVNHIIMTAGGLGPVEDGRGPIWESFRLFQLLFNRGLVISCGAMWEAGHHFSG